MAYTILSESYGRRLPKITAEADSTEDLTALGTDYAEGSTCNVGGTEYTLDKVGGWIVPGGGGGGGGDFLVTITDNGGTYTADKTNAEIFAAAQSGKRIFASYTDPDGGIAQLPMDKATADLGTTFSRQSYTADGGYGITVYISEENVISLTSVTWSVEED